MYAEFSSIDQDYFTSTSPMMSSTPSSPVSSMKKVRHEDREEEVFNEKYQQTEEEKELDRLLCKITIDVFNNDAASTSSREKTIDEMKVGEDSFKLGSHKHSA